jgi:excisionase family DNA binding protein
MSRELHFYTPSQIAQMLQMNVLTVYGFIKKNQLAAVKIGRSYRVEQRDLEQFLKTNKC